MESRKQNNIIILPTSTEVNDFCKAAAEVGFLSYSISQIVQAGIWASGDDERIQAASRDILELFRAEDSPATTAHLEFLSDVVQSFYTALWNKMQAFGIGENHNYDTIGVDSRHCAVLQERSHYERHNDPGSGHGASG